MSRTISGCRSACLTLSFILAAPGVASAGPGMWTSGGPYGGALTVAVDPTNAATVYAGTGREVFKSTDSGATWAPAATGLPVTEVYVLAIVASAPATIYAGTSKGVFRSTDSGGSWTKASSGLSAAGGVKALAIDPALPTTLYAGVWMSGIFKSTDGGDSWARVSFLGRSTNSLVIPPGGSGTVYAGTYDYGVLKFTPAGGWVVASTGLTFPDVLSLAVEPSAPGTLYAGTSGGGIFKSTDAGGSWAHATSGLKGSYIWTLAADPATPGRLYAGSYGGVFKSTDAGGSWTPASGGLTNPTVRSLALSPSAPATLYGATRGGVFRSTDSAGSWTEADTGITGRSVGTLAVAPSAPATLYAGTYWEGDVFKSTDAGGSWAPASTGLPSRYPIWALAVDPATPSTLYAGVQLNGVFKSTDAGASWSPSNAGMANAIIVALVIHPSAPATVYAVESFDIFKSTDGGGTWNGGSGLPLPIRDLAQDPSTPATLYAGTSAGPYKSTDAGGSWAAANVGWPEGVEAQALAIDPATPTTLYAGTDLFGAFRSTDAGGTWSKAGLSYDEISSLAVDPSGTVYAGRGVNDGGGLYRSTDSGASWVAVNKGLVDPVVSALALDPAGTTLFAGLFGGSVWQATPPPALVKGDLNGDSQPDLVFRSTVAGAQNKAWFMDGVTRTAEAAVSPDAASADWRIRGVDDFDADGRNDLVFRNQLTGQVEFWLMNGTARLGVPVPLTGGAVLDPGWELAATADFNHDTLPDLVWRNATSQKIVIWTMNGTSKFGNVTPTPAQAVDGNWAIVAALDYDHDGNTDFLWYNSTSGKIVTWYMDASVVRTSGQFTSPANAGDANWKVVASGDFSREYVPGTPPLGSPDIVWRNETSGNQVVWHMDFASTRVHGEFTSPAANTPALDWTIVGPR